jgi:hypothetical protein
LRENGNDLDAELCQEDHDFLGALPSTPDADDNARFIDADDTSSVRAESRMMDKKCSASGSCSRTAMKTELSTTIIRSGPRLFENILRRPRIKQRPGGYAPGYVARAIDIGGLAVRAAFGDCDTGNSRLHLDTFS